MKRVVLGTAGHIDHGKTALTKALTGVDTDRLQDEKLRGITIELGFASMKLTDGSEISLIDVPGHERFVRTMMAGVSGIDGVIFLIAADDGVMPQTREHFDILRLLKLKRGVIALTKVDLVDEERIQIVRAQIAELVEGSFLEGAPVCPVSAVSGMGIPELRLEIEALVSGIGERDIARPFRMSIDRCFPVAGFGSVAAGTVTEGAVRVGDTVEFLPGGMRGRIRTLQTHGSNVVDAHAGMRVAMSFSGLGRDTFERGMVVAETESVCVSDTLTVKIDVLPDCPYSIKNSSQLHFFHGTHEAVCKLRLLDADALRSGQSGFAQLKFSEAVAVRLGDRFLLRFFSPVVTIGGGAVLACGNKRLRRNNEAVLERLNRLSADDTVIRIEQLIDDGGLVPVRRDLLRKYANLSPDEYNVDEDRLVNENRIVEIADGSLLSVGRIDERLDQLIPKIRQFHDTYPLQVGMRLVSWRKKLFPEDGAPVDAILRYWSDRKLVRYENGVVSLPDFVPVFTQEHKIMQRRLLHHYREAWFIAPNTKDVSAKFERFGTLYEQIFENMVVGGMLIPLSAQYRVHFEAEKDARRIFSDLAQDGHPVTLAEFRTAAGISRKYSQLFLEYWDRTGFTRRVEDAHIMLHTDIQKA